MNARFRPTVASACLAAATMTATSHAADLRVFFAPQGLSSPANESSAITGPPTLGNVTWADGPSPRRLYIWVQFGADAALTTNTRVVGLAINVVTTGSTVITARQFFDYQVIDNSDPKDPVLTFRRWMVINQGTIAGGGQAWTGANGMWAPLSVYTVSNSQTLGNTTFIQGKDAQYNLATDSTCVGWVEVDGPGQVFLQVGTRGIALRNGARSDNIFLGFADAAIRADAFSTSSAQADATITPAPTCVGDVASPPNGLVNTDDLIQLIGAWGSCNNCATCAGDIAPPGGNCQVNTDDLIALITSWGPCP
jgi:hypothetical protein